MAIDIRELPLSLFLAVIVVLLLSATAVFGIGFLGSGDDPYEDSTPLPLEFEERSLEYGIAYERSPFEDGPDRLRGTQLFNGKAGAFVTDYTRNGKPDLLLIGDEEPILYRNTGSSFVESAALPAVSGNVRSALFLDYNRNNRPDLLLLRMNRTPVMLENTGDEFVEVDVGLDRQLDVPISGAAADYTGNGCLDLFIIQNGDWVGSIPNGQWDVGVPLNEDNGLPNVLYTGDCSSFSEADAGIEGARWSLATSFLDFTGNGLPDIHVAEDFNRDVIYVNNGDGTFEQTTLENSDRNAMSSAINDMTRNGHPDIFVTNIWFSEQLRMTSSVFEISSIRDRGVGNNLFENRGDGTFVDIASEVGVEKGGWGWAAVTQDLTNNGFVDIVHANSDYHLLDLGDYNITDEEFYKKYPFYDYPAAFVGTSHGFESVDAQGAGFHTDDSRGIAELDANGNGKLDLVLTNNDGPFFFYENQADGGNSLIIDVQSTNTTTAIGSTVQVEAGTETYYRWIESNSDFLSQGDQAVHVGVGSVEHVNVTVEWPDGTAKTLDSLETGARYVIDPSGVLETFEFENDR